MSDQRIRRCGYRPEPGHLPAMDCWSLLTEAELMAHIDQWHPSRRRWDDAEHGAGKVLRLGFTSEEVDAMEQRAWPAAVETWIHELVAEALKATR